MYEPYSRQALPSKEYRELLGSAICVFNSNNSFVIENILANDQSNEFSWHELIDRTSGDLSKPIKDTITKRSNTKIAQKFENIIQKRNRIAHSFQVTDSKESDYSDGIDNQILATKYKNGKQEYITQDFLHNFIKENEELSDMLHKFRDF